MATLRTSIKHLLTMKKGAREGAKGVHVNVILVTANMKSFVLFNFSKSPTKSVKIRYHRSCDLVIEIYRKCYSSLHVLQYANELNDRNTNMIEPNSPHANC